MNHFPFRILLLDKDESSIRRVEEILKLTSNSCFIEVVKSVTDFQYALPGRRFDLILAEIDLARDEVWRATKLARESHPGTPFIVIADRMAPGVWAEATGQGVWDYVLHDNLPALPFAVCRARETRANALEHHVTFQSELLNLTNEAITVRKLDGTIVSWNESARQMYGWTPADAYSRNIRTLRPSGPEGKAWEHAGETCALQGTWAGDIVRRGRSGEEFAVSSRWIALRDGYGNMNEIVEIDSPKVSTEGPKLTDDMKRTIHTLNNMLGAISNVGEMLKGRTDDGFKGELFQILHTSAERAADLVKKLTNSQGAKAPASPEPPLPDQKVVDTDEVPVSDYVDQTGDEHASLLLVNGG